jgi:oligoribonuclease NrnB/cAMP/cGMP phosphodiesterase (DHH superfamily)
VRNQIKQRADILSLSHFDLDGIGCQFVIREYLGEPQRMNVGYDKIDEYISIVHEHCSRTSPDYVFVTDLSFSSEQLTALHEVTQAHKNTMFYFIDHHPFEEPYEHLKADNFRIVISPKASGTKLTNLYLKKNFDVKENKDLDDIVEYINAYDIWLDDTKAFKVGFVYNELFWLYGIDHFWSRFKDEYSLRNSDKNLYKEQMLKKKKLFDKLQKSGRMMTIGQELFMIFIDEFQAHVTVDFPGYKVYVIISSKGKTSVRLKNIQDCESVQKSILNRVQKLDNINNYGGHHSAFGIGLNDNSPKNLITFAKEMMHVVDEALTENGLA